MTVFLLALDQMTLAFSCSFFIQNEKTATGKVKIQATEFFRNEHD